MMASPRGPPEHIGVFPHHDRSHTHTHKAVRRTTSEVRTLSYSDDTVLVGPADDIANMIQELPRALTSTGLSLHPQKTQFWATQGDQNHTPPRVENRLQSQDERFRGLIILGEALGEDPTDPYLLGNEAFIQDQTRDVADAVTHALVSKTLPPWVVHLLRAHPVEHAQEPCPGQTGGCSSP